MPSCKFNNNEIVIQDNRKGFVNSSTYDAATDSYTVSVTFKWTRRERWVSGLSGALEKEEYWTYDLTGGPENVPEGQLKRAPES